MSPADFLVAGTMIMTGCAGLVWLITGLRAIVEPWRERRREEKDARRFRCVADGRRKTG